MYVVQDYGAGQAGILKIVDCEAVNVATINTWDRYGGQLPIAEGGVQVSEAVAMARMLCIELTRRDGIGK